MARKKETNPTPDNNTATLVAPTSKAPLIVASTFEAPLIEVYGAREHNLKNIQNG